MKPSLKSTSKKHLAWQNLWSCSDSVGIWYIGLRITLLTVWLGSMQILIFLGVSFITPLQHHEMGSTFFMMPAAAYLSRASFSSMLLATGTPWIGICTGEMSLFTLKWTKGPRQPRPFKFFMYCYGMCSFVSSPDGGRHLLGGFWMGCEDEGADLSLHGQLLLDWS